jgi:hypothetical protein
MMLASFTQKKKQCWPLQGYPLPPLPSPLPPPHTASSSPAAPGAAAAAVAVPRGTCQVQASTSRNSREAELRQNPRRTPQNMPSVCRSRCKILALTCNRVPRSANVFQVFVPSTQGWAMVTASFPGRHGDTRKHQLLTPFLILPHATAHMRDDPRGRRADPRRVPRPRQKPARRLQARVRGGQPAVPRILGPRCARAQLHGELLRRPPGRGRGALVEAAGAGPHVAGVHVRPPRRRVRAAAAEPGGARRARQAGVPSPAGAVRASDFARNFSVCWFRLKLKTASRIFQLFLLLFFICHSFVLLQLYTNSVLNFCSLRKNSDSLNLVF